MPGLGRGGETRSHHSRDVDGVPFSLLWGQARAGINEQGERNVPHSMSPPWGPRALCGDAPCSASAPLPGGSDAVSGLGQSHGGKGPGDITGRRGASPSVKFNPPQGWCETDSPPAARGRPPPCRAPSGSSHAPGRAQRWGKRPRCLQAREKLPGFQRRRVALPPGAVSVGRWARGLGKGSCGARGLQMPAA